MPNDTKILPSVTTAGLRALASSMLVPSAHARLDDLLSQSKEGKLTAEEQGELDSLIEQIDELNLLKARAEYTLRHHEEAGGA